MKPLFIILLSVSMVNTSLGQEVPIEYKGKYSFDKYLMRQLTMFNTDYASDDTISKYFDAIIEFDAVGKISSLSIFSVNDDILTKTIKKVIMATDGQWKNNTGKTVSVSQQIFWEFMDDPNKNKILKFEKSIKGKADSVYELKPIKTEYAKPQR